MFCLYVHPPETQAAAVTTAWTSQLGNSGLSPVASRAGRGYAAISFCHPSVPAEGRVPPMVDNDAVVLFDGRLDYRHDLLRRLGLDANANCTDAELFLHAYRRWGSDCPRHLYGDFAAAIWHIREQRLWACTDHCSHRRLYYAEINGGFVVSTHLPCLVATPGCSRAIDGRVLGLLLLALIPRGRTAFHSIYYLPPGYTARWAPGKSAAFERWWQPELSEVDDRRTPPELAEELTAVFRQAVIEHLKGAPAVAASVSGGLDSTLVSAFAAQELGHSGRPLFAYTAVPHPGLAPELRPNWESSDWGYAAQIASRYPNVRHAPVHAGTPCVLEHFRRNHIELATPVRNSANSQWLMAACEQASAAGCRALLTGQRGNFTVSQSRDNDALIALIGSGQWQRLYTELRLKPGGLPRKLAGLAYRLTIGRLRAARVNRKAFRDYAPLPPHTFSRKLRDAQDQLIRPLDFSGAAGRYRAAQLSTSFAADTRITCGVEFRDPTADRRLIEKLLRLPAHAFLWQGKSRALARLMGDSVVPDEIRWRTTRGEQAPEEAGYFTLHADRYREAWATTAKTPLATLWDSSALARLLEDLIAGHGNRTQAIFMHRVLDAGLFVQHIHDRWGPQDFRFLPPRSDYPEEDLSAW